MSTVVDRNLLFGVLALQADLITPTRFAEACAEWAAHKDRPLSDLLLQRGWISADDRTDLDLRRTGYAESARCPPCRGDDAV
jgi:hypothetical protein